MLKNYIKIALRNLWKSKIFSTINILGLAIGIAASFMMFLIVIHEMSYDQHIEHIERKGRILSDNADFKMTSVFSSNAVRGELINSCPMIKKSARAYYSTVYFGKNNYNYDEREQGYFIDPDLLDILSIKLKYGEFDENKRSVAISEELSNTLYGTDNSVGKKINIKIADKEILLTVGGVYYAIPKTSTFNSDILLPFILGEDFIHNRYQYKSETPLTDWKAETVYTYFELNSTADFSSFNHLLKQISETKIPEEWNSTMRYQELDDVYFDSKDLYANRLPQGDLNKIIIFTVVAILILIIASINFILLSSANLLKRMEEIGIRKVIGADTKTLLGLFITEGLIISLLILPISMLIIEVTFQNIYELLAVTIYDSIFNHFEMYIALWGIAVFVVVFSSTFVSLYFLKKNPINLMKGNFGNSGSQLKFRNAFITAQIVITVGLIIAIITVFNQNNYLRNKDLGFNTDNIFVIHSWDDQLPEKYEVIKNELLTLEGIKGVSGASELPPQLGGAIMNFPRSKGSDEKVVVRQIGVDYNFLEVMGMKLIEGRDFSKKFSTEESSRIINETARKEFNLKGKNKFEQLSYDHEIIGIVKDFNIESLHHRVVPTILKISKTKYINDVIINVGENQLFEKVAKVKDKVNEILPDIEIDYYFLDEKIEGIYQDEFNFAKVMNIATVLAVFLTCLGLFGIMLFIAEQRTKEIGIRKVLGASVSNLVSMISKEFVLLVIVGVVIASPITYYLMNKWLDNFAYKIEIGFGTVSLAAAMALLITLFTVSIQAVKAAVANPVESLRDE